MEIGEFLENFDKLKSTQQALIVAIGKVTLPVVTIKVRNITS